MSVTVWGILGFATVCIGTIIGLLIVYVKTLKKYHATDRQKYVYELGLKSANETIQALKNERERKNKQLEILRKALKDIQDELVKGTDPNIIRDTLDELLSEEMSKDSEDSSKS